MLAAADYTFLVTGEPPAPTEAADVFQAMPPGHTPDDMLKLGIRRDDERLLGILDLCRGYPAPGTWYIGLLLLHPDARGQGAGRAVIEALADFARTHGAQRLMLSVLEENVAALHFWSAVGFERIRTLPPRRFGVKDHARIEFESMVS
jgi:ribosomal protein S18 acetylase RimI-like enzyme